MLHKQDYKMIGDIITFPCNLLKEDKEKQKEFISRTSKILKQDNERFDEDKFINYVLERIEDYENKHKN
jgi:hypothetical protein